jgi:hypothetical protein
MVKAAEAIPDVLAGTAKAQETDPPGGLAIMDNALEALGSNFSTEKS